MPFEVFSTVQHVDGSLQCCRRCGVIDAWRFRFIRYTQCLCPCNLPLYTVPTLAWRDGKGVDKTWNLQTCLRTILIIVHAKTVSAVVFIVPCPLIRAMETHIKLLSTTESIAFRQTNDDLWTEPSTCFAFPVSLNIEVIRLVEDTIYSHIKHMTGVSRVARGEVQTRSREESACAKLPLALLLCLRIVERSWPHLQVIGYGSHTQGHPLAIIIDYKVAETTLTCE